MKEIIYDNKMLMINVGFGRLVLPQKPKFSFDFDYLQYHFSNKSKYIDDKEIALNDSEIREIESVLDCIDESFCLDFFQNESNKQYLYETDFYLIRKIETGKDAPLDVLSKRQIARDSIKDIEFPFLLVS
jgi:hypothetical protein